MSFQLSVFSKLCIMNTLLLFSCYFSFAVVWASYLLWPSLRQIKSDYHGCLIMLTSPECPILVLPGAPPTLNPPLVVSHHLTTLFNTTNAVSKPQQCNRLCKVYPTKQSRIPSTTTAKLQIILTKYAKFLQNLFIRWFTFAMDPKPSVLLKIIYTNFEIWKWGGPRFMRPKC